MKRSIQAEKSQVQTSGIFIENFSAILADNDHIFQPDSAPAGQINTRLHGDNHTGPELFAAAGRQSRVFMHGKTDAMAKRMPEIFPIPGVINDPAGGQINLPAGNTCPDGLNTGQLCPAHHAQPFKICLVRLTGDKGPGQLNTKQKVGQCAPERQPQL